MKKFLLHIASILLFTLAIMAVLDFAYTKVYENSFPRSKFQLFRSLANSNVDYAFFGSSRVDNHIIPEIIINKTGKQAYNLGITGSKPNDIYVMLKLCKDYNINIERTFIQIDNDVDMKGYSLYMTFEVAPFVRDNDITKDYFTNVDPIKGRAYYYIPFYRYCVFDQKIGFREMFCNLTDIKTVAVKRHGYNVMTGNKIGNYKLIPGKNRTEYGVLDSIKNFCSINKFDATYYCAPFAKETKNLYCNKELKLIIPDLVDYSSSLPDSKMFGNNSHLNDSGAIYFTNLLVDDLIMKK